jgi:predicted ATPase/DNA-binding XRE family transcriptional regulator
MTGSRGKMMGPMKSRAPGGSFGAQLKALRDAAGFTQEELATIAGLSVHAVSALERGERRRPHVDTVRALSAALDLSGATRDALFVSARAPAHTAADELGHVSLPLALTVLLGREADLQILRDWLADDVARLITLTGPGGSGKTRLALELARTMAADAATRVVFVPLAAIRNSAFVAPAIAEALGLSDTNAIDLPRRARGVCNDRPTLLVLDNFEQVLDAAPLVADLLTSVASLRTLATSRAALRVRGEREYAVGPLALEAGVEAVAPADVGRSPAVRLFVERARDVQPDFRLTSSNVATVAAICRRLDALPLALELAAPWIKVLAPEDLLDRLAHDVLLSAAGPRDLPERQQTMNATVAWSYQLLGPTEQRAFRRFGALPGRFPIEAAAAVLAGRSGDSAGLDEALRAAAGLIDKSLLLRAETSVATRPLYQTLETVRAFAALKLAAAGERDDALEGLAQYATREASFAAKGLAGPAQSEWLNRIRDDLENYRGALSWLIEHGRSAEASDIAWALMLFWLVRGHAGEGLGWYEQIVALPSVSPLAELRALTASGLMCYARGEFARARTMLTRARALAPGAGDEEAAAQADHVLGYVEHSEGNLAAARDCFMRSIDGFRALPDHWGTGHALSGLAWVAVTTGDDDEARRLVDEATSLLRHVGPWYSALALYVRAILALRRDTPDEAIAVVRKSLTQSRQLEDKFACVGALRLLAIAAALKGDATWAARILGARDTVIEQTGTAFVDQSIHALAERAEGDVRARLGPDRWARAYAAGRGASIDSLLRDIESRRARS